MNHDIAKLQLTLNTHQDCDNNAAATGRKLGVSASTVKGRLAQAAAAGLTAGEAVPDEFLPEVEIIKLRDEIRTLRATIQNGHREEITRKAIHKHILQIADADPNPPQWMVKPPRSGHVLGVPTLFASDWHWGEVVNPSEVANANSFNTEIAHKRVRKLLDTTCDLLLNRFATPDYPGIVLAIGGDMVTGTIHEDLLQGSDQAIGPCVLDVFGVLVWLINSLAVKFDKVFVPGVAGNHGRTTRKPVAKNRAATNWDWLILKFLQRHFQNDDRVSFLIPDGPDARFNIYSHRYLLTHGDQFRGGGGVAGPLMTIVRGRHKKASRDVALDNPWDTIIMGHWHQLIQLQDVIVNSTLKGIDEYAFQGNFGYERPSQALWITHPRHGIAYQMPVYVDERRVKSADEWVSWKK